MYGPKIGYRCPLIAAGAFTGGVVGNTIGASIGWIADEAISRGCVMTFTGSWVSNSSHQHNGIHDIDRALLIECNDCKATASTTAARLLAAVGIGRHPTGRDP